MLADGWKDKENDKESNKKEAMADVSEGNKESSKEDVQILSGGRVSHQILLLVVANGLPRLKQNFCLAG